MNKRSIFAGLIGSAAFNLSLAKGRVAIVIIALSAPVWFHGVAYGTDDAWKTTTGNWSIGSNWSTGSQPTPSQNAVITDAGGAVTEDVSATIQSLTIGSGDSLGINNGITLTIKGSTISNSGNFSISGGNAVNAVLSIGANTTLSGGGTVTLTSEGGQAIIQGNGFTLTNANNTIQGYGTIGNGSLTLTNGGIVDATQPAVTLLLNGTGGITNTNLLEATNTGVLQIQNTINNSGGNITANGGTVNFVGADIQGGTLNEKNNGGNGGFLGAPVGASVTLDGSTHGSLTLSSGSTYTGQFGSTTNVMGTINNNGNFQFNGGNASNAVLNLTSSTTFQGNGTVTLSSEGGTAIIQGNGFTLTNANNTIQGYGTIGNGTLSLVNGSGGTIFATQQGVQLLVNAGGKITNNGTFKVASGTTLHVTSGAFTNFSGTTLTGGTYNTAGTLQIDELGTSGGEIVTNAANIILSGPSSVFVDANANNALSAFNSNASKASFTIKSGANFTTAGNFTNNGTLTVGNGSSFVVNLASNLTNFNATTHTLTGGSYVDSGILQFKGANIQTIAVNTSLTISGASAKIEDQTGAANGLTNLATNNGTFGIASGFNFTTAGNFTNNGTLSIGSGTKFTINLADSLTNFNGTTHTLAGGTYLDSGILQFKGANIQTIAANTALTMSGASAKIEDQTGVANGLTNFATNNGTFATASGFNFTTAGNFTNNGTLSIGSGSRFTVNLANSLTNFNGTTHTLTGGTYGITGTLQFNNANIVTNAANITLTGTTSQIVNQSNANALANFATNNGSFALAGKRSFTTAGNFTNAGTLTVNSGSTFSVGGPGVFTQSGGMTADNGTLSASGGINLNGGLLFGTGSITGAIKSNSSASINPGISSTTAGVLKETGAYNQNSGTLDITINGKTAGTQYDQFNPTTASLSGTLNINRLSSFIPTIGSTFKIMSFSSETGTFSAVNGLVINSTEHFSVTYQPTDVLLTVVSGALTASQLTSGVSTIPASGFVPIQSDSDDDRSNHMLFASTGLMLPTVAADLNTRSTVPDYGSTFVLLSLAFAACVLFRRRFDDRRAV